MRYFVIRQRIRGFLNNMRYINSRFTYLLTYFPAEKKSSVCLFMAGWLQSSLSIREYSSSDEPPSNNEVEVTEKVKVKVTTDQG